MQAIQLYGETIIVFFFINNILVWGLNMQFGYSGILNFAYIIFMAIGAYVSGALALPAPTSFGGQNYILGWSWPFPLTMIAGALVAAAVGVLVGFIALKRLRSDYMAIVTVAVGAIAFDLIGNNVHIFNGQDGLGAVPQPLIGFATDTLGLDYNGYQVFYIGICFVTMLVLWLVTVRIRNSPFGRTLRSIREDQDVTEAFGKDTFRYRMIMMALGSFYAGIGGALLIGFSTALNPSGWTTGETFVIWAALLIGGSGNNWGALLGAALVPVGLQEVTRYMPQITQSLGVHINPDIFPPLRNIVVGAILILVLWFRPQGIIPEPRARFEETPTTREPTPVLPGQEATNAAISD